jgi:hypothetical protein
MEKMMNIDGVYYEDIELEKLIGDELEKLISEHPFFGGTETNSKTGVKLPAPDLMIKVTRELVARARLLGWSEHELFFEVIWEAARLQQFPEGDGSRHPLDGNGEADGEADGARSGGHGRRSRGI